MKKNILLIFLILLSTRIFSQKIPESTQFALEKSGKNINELKKVLDQFSQFEKDSLKFISACYLIENMPGHFGIYHPEGAYDAVFENIKNTLLNGIDTLDWKRARKTSKKATTDQSGFPLYDINTIKSDFLTRHIDNAFYIWKKYPWCREINFEAFKRQILLYRIATEPLTDLNEYFQNRYAWLIDSVKHKNNMAEAFSIVYKDFYKSRLGGWWYGNIVSINDVIEYQGGSCNDECLFLSMVMRSLGIISSFDNTPVWANRTSGHAWISFTKDEGHPLFMDIDTILGNHKYLNSAVFEINDPGTKFLPNDILLMPAKKAAKVLRRSFIINNNSSVLINNKEEEIPTQFNDLFLHDVTETYLTSYEVKLNIPENSGKKFAYICVFDLGKLYPVDWAEIKGNHITFKDMGSDVLYFTAIYQSGEYYPITEPFILKNNGEIQFLKKGSEIKENLTIKRKYPLFGNILNYANNMYGAKFQGSLNADFSNSVDLYTINETPFTPTEIQIANAQKFRYFRYLPLNKTTGDIAELQFYTKENEQDVILNGNLIFKYSGPQVRSYVKAFDGNIETFYKSDTTGTWIGIDLGKGTKKSVSKITFCPRSDTDFIIPNNKYELSYWENGWHTLGFKIAKDYNIVFDNVPTGCLYWLHCLNGGSEERPFTWENGKQVWW